ncbi:hypothetical protein SE17_30060 [Kouleothrix aurantiaca]|uniref:Uncharacterized protein n=1 Tax=Kouleothrix aurantiaca TaxID=186479 RepID=A0A0N8PRG9_9CHLR|nr:hypothetical protein SE17_30060 [Kouleothrix aurantiaca]
MKQIGRTIIILVAAALVCGAAYALAGNRSAGGFEGRPPGFEQQAGGANGTTAGAPRRPGGFERRGGERGGSFLGGIFEVLRSLLIVAVVAALALPVMRMFTRRRPGTPAESEDVAAP